MSYIKESPEPDVFWIVPVPKVAWKITSPTSKISNEVCVAEMDDLVLLLTQELHS